MIRTRAFRIVRTAFAVLVAVGVTMTAVIGFAHTKMGRPLLPWLGLGMSHASARAGGKCPLGFDKNKRPDEKEAGRQHFAAVHRGTALAPERPALGFVLDRTTRKDVETWGKTNGLACAPPRGGADYECLNVPADRLPQGGPRAPVQTLWFNFGGNDTLASVIVVLRDASAEGIAGAFDAVKSDLGRAGPPSKLEGDVSPEHLSGLLSQASAEYRFRNYYAVARATNMGKDYVLTEEVRSLPN